MTALINTSEMTNTELVKNAYVFSKYDGDLEATEIVNSVLEELKWNMSPVAFSELKKDLVNKFPLFYA